MRLDRGVLMKRVLPIARFVFVLTAIVFGAWSLTANWSSVSESLRSVNGSEVTIAMLLVVVGLIVGASMFSVLLTSMGYPIPTKFGQTVFLVGSLGKYIPGSVWFLAAQADIARRLGVPSRKTVTVGLLVVYWAFFSAVAAAAGGTVIAHLAPAVPRWIVFVVGLLSVCALIPQFLGWIGRKLSGDESLANVTLVQVGKLVAGFSVIWIVNGVAVAVLTRGFSDESLAVSIIASTGAFALAFAVGLAVPLAPAGFGLREGTLVFLLSPTIGIGPALVAATLMRVLHLVGDFGLAAASWLLVRRSLIAFEPSNSYFDARDPSHE